MSPVRSTATCARADGATLESRSPAVTDGVPPFSAIGRSMLGRAWAQTPKILGDFFRSVVGARLARPSLMGLAMLTQSGCLLGEAPEYQSRRQTPAVLLTDSAEPSLNRVIRGRVSEPHEFKVLYRSEDAGDRMAFILFKNFNTEDSTYLAANSAAPSSNLYPDEGEPTQAALTYNFRDTDVGCNSYTLLLTHASNLNVLEPQEPSDIAYVTWWAAVVNLNGEPADILVDDCGGGQ